MLVTEAEAKTKWCSQTRAIAAGVDKKVSAGQFIPVINRPHHPEGFPDHCCLGSGCMHWCWDNDYAPMDDKPRQGWCGLGSKGAP